MHREAFDRGNHVEQHSAAAGSVSRSPAMVECFRTAGELAADHVTGKGVMEATGGLRID